MKHSARSRDGTGMVTRTQSAPTDAGTIKWWPSKYGAEDQADFDPATDEARATWMAVNTPEPARG